MRSDWLLSGQDFLVMTGHYEKKKKNICVCFVKLVVKFVLDLDVIKTKNVSLSKKLCLVVSIASVQ